MNLQLERLCLNCMQEGMEGSTCTLCNKPMPTQQNPNNALPLGTILHGQYLIGRVLGHGGFGMTYIALNLASGARMAIKEYFPNGLCSRVSGQTLVRHANEDEFNYGLRHFVDEANTIHALARIPNIITIEKLFNENNTAYYAMEFLQGCDLREFLKRKGGKMSLTETVNMLSPLMDSLAMVHDARVIHRDIAPDNIYVLQSGTIKLIDFGAAHAELSQKSKSYALVLKKGYAPVEQYVPNSAQNPQGPWTDVYALACTVYRCITGQLPAESIVRASNPAALILPSQMGVKITRGQEQVLLKGMAVLRQERYQNVREFAADLRRAIGSTSAVIPPREKEIDPTPQPTPPPVIVDRGDKLVPKRKRRTLLDFIFFWRLFKKPEYESVIVPDPDPISPLPPTDLPSGSATNRPTQVTDVNPPGIVTLPNAVQEYRLVCIQGVYAGSSAQLFSEALCIGRDPDYCNIVYPKNAPGISATHLKVWYDALEQQVMVEDLGSSYGTYLKDGSRLTPHTIMPLNDGDTFLLGAAECFRVEKVRSAQSGR